MDSHFIMNSTDVFNATRMGTSQVIGQSVLIAMIPAGVMFFLGAITVFWPRPPSKSIAHAIQHLAAGILLSAIALELIPTIAAAKEKMSIVGMVVGFSLGAIVMITLPMLLDEEDEADGELETEMDEGVNLMSDPTVNPLPAPPAPLPTASSAEDIIDITSTIEKSPMATASINPDTIRTDLSRRGDAVAEQSSSAQDALVQRVFLRRLHALRALFNNKPSAAVADPERGPHGPIDAVPASGGAFPGSFAGAVFIDSAMDGLLVGISLITGESAGLFMAVAMASEMGFLGISFATAVAHLPKYKSLPAVAGGPLFMLLGATVGGAVANALSVNEPLLVGCTSFGVAALLYMVTEELLVSAHEDGFGHRWWVDIQVFVGFLLALVVGKLIEK